MAKKRTMDELRQVKDSVYKHPNVDSENPIPTDFWDELSESEKEALHKAQEEAQEEYLNYDEWEEMDNDFYEHLRERFQKGPDEIGPRQWKSFQNKVVPMQLMVIPAGRQHDGEKSKQSRDAMIASAKSGASVLINPQAGIVLVKAYPDQIDRVAKYLRDVESAIHREVVIDAKILEVRLNAGYQQGINWKLLGASQEGNTDLTSNLPSFTMPSKNSSLVFQLNICIRNAVPLLDRMHLSLNGSHVLGPKPTASNPNASAVRKSVPTFPGSWTPSMHNTLSILLLVFFRFINSETVLISGISNSATRSIPSAFSTPASFFITFAVAPYDDDDEKNTLWSFANTSTRPSSSSSNAYTDLTLTFVFPSRKISFNTVEPTTTTDLSSSRNALDVLSFTNRFTFAFSTLEIIDFFTGFVASFSSSFSSSSSFARVVAWQRVVVALLLEE